MFFFGTVRLEEAGDQIKFATIACPSRRFFLRFSQSLFGSTKKIIYYLDTSKPLCYRSFLQRGKKKEQIQFNIA